MDIYILVLKAIMILAPIALCLGMIFMPRSLIKYRIKIGKSYGMDFERLISSQERLEKSMRQLGLVVLLSFTIVVGFALYLQRYIIIR